MTIEAGEDTMIWFFNLKSIAEPNEATTPFTMFVRRLAIRMLLKSEEHSNLFKLYTPTERYHYIAENNPKLIQRIPLSQLASYLGVTRETLSRIRAKGH